MTIKTCEEYVLNELNNEISKNERLTKEVEELGQENKELKEKNNKLMDLIKLFAKKAEIDKEQAFCSLFLHSCYNEDDEAIEELIKIKEQLENEVKNNG